MSTSQYEQLVASAEAGKPDAQFLLSQLLSQAGDVDGMLGWLQKASDREFPEALAALGRCHEQGHGVAIDVAAAADYYDRAIEGGSAIARLSKAQLLYKSKQGAASAASIRELLLDAAGNNVVPALRAVGYLALQQAANHQHGIDCLRRAAGRGDIVSAFMLGYYLGGSQSQRQAAGEAVFWLQKAAEAQFPLAKKVLASLAGTPPMPPPMPGDGPVALSAELALDPQPSTGEREVMNDDPPIALIRNVLTVADCAYLIHLSRPQMTRAHVIDPSGNTGGQISNVRTSMSTYLPFGMVDIVGRFIEQKIATATGETLLNSEPMSILYYAPGEYYRPHVDYFNPKLDVSAALMRDGGQRTASAVTYLTAPSVGGGTSFPRLDITVPPVAGGTLWFRNCLSNGEVDERSLHAGDTVGEGEKWVVTKWFREGPTQYMPM